MGYFFAAHRRRTPNAPGDSESAHVNWPAGIHDAGSIRTQFHHVTDITPTLHALQILNHRAYQ